jgi:hypothetical protein
MTKLLKLKAAARLASSRVAAGQFDQASFSRRRSEVKTAQSIGNKAHQLCVSVIVKN